ncbi:DUF983 domain-containing protein [Acuticoccus sp. M5D2P5]|uniref:DUF983 domain-containing protein n=1 Tax=Acuticoccus kalidii TaxID=2910977 RepID=UPI001F2AB30F|nr:DUF983 domain-containing protein [Acuticoccus kalidii]MCF3935521.1 DUF983 domain-containing protein [Acuticoccus kalidii]
MSTRPLLASLYHGARCRCPKCGTGRLFGRFLKVEPVCAHCGEELHHQRADDAPPYMVMLIVGHVVIGLMLSFEIAYHPAMWLHAAIFLPMAIAMSLVLLQPVKGTLIGLQWANEMHGFGGEETHA